MQVSTRIAGLFCTRPFPWNSHSLTVASAPDNRWIICWIHSHAWDFRVATVLSAAPHATNTFLSHSHWKLARNFLHYCTPAEWEKNIQRKDWKDFKLYGIRRQTQRYINRMDATNESGRASILLPKKCSAKMLLTSLLFIRGIFFSTLLSTVRHSWLKRPAKMPFCINVIIHIENDKWCCVFVSLIFVDSATYLMLLSFI